MSKVKTVSLPNIAHELGSKPRTKDVILPEDTDTEFSSMLLPQSIQDGLHKAGFIKPSPIQLKAIPLARCGFDLIVQAKSGTGKTCVFTVAALETLIPNSNRVQVLVLAPTREIAIQIEDVVRAIGCVQKKLKVRCCIGGTPFLQDKSNLPGCQIVVGAPGRIRHLIEEKLLLTDAIRLFVLDEADKLLEEPFQDDINAIFHHLPESKQVIACSATYTKELVKFLGNYMQSATHVTPGSDPSPVLLGLRHFIYEAPASSNYLIRCKVKEDQLLEILKNVPFCQCLVFSNYHTRAESICNVIKRKGWKAVWIAGVQDQETRTSVYTKVKYFKARILVTTDLMARGLDFGKVNLVINMDLPADHHTYLHRMGRAGRYGGHGIVITLVSKDEILKFKILLNKIGSYSKAHKIPDCGPTENLWSADMSEFEIVEGDIEAESDEVAHRVKVKSRYTGKSDKGGNNDDDDDDDDDSDDDRKAVMDGNIKMVQDDFESDKSSNPSTSSDDDADDSVGGEDEAMSVSDGIESIGSPAGVKPDLSLLSEFGSKLMEYSKTPKFKSYFELEESLNDFVQSKSDLDETDCVKLLEPPGSLDTEVVDYFLLKISSENKILEEISKNVTVDRALEWLKESTRNDSVNSNLLNDVEQRDFLPDFLPKVTDVVVDKEVKQKTSDVLPEVYDGEKSSKTKKRYKNESFGIVDLISPGMKPDGENITSNIKTGEKDPELYSQSSSDDEVDDNFIKSLGGSQFTNASRNASENRYIDKELNSFEELHIQEPNCNVPMSESSNQLETTSVCKTSGSRCELNRFVKYKDINNDCGEILDGTNRNKEEELNTVSRGKRTNSDKCVEETKSKSRKTRMKQNKSKVDDEIEFSGRDEQGSCSGSSSFNANGTQKYNIERYANQVRNYNSNYNLQGMQHWYDMYSRQSAQIRWYVGYCEYVRNMLRPN